jgi:hypothetical protein
MAHKFVIVSFPGEREGMLLCGDVGQHRDLVHEFEQRTGRYVRVHGGGWYHQNERDRIFTLYGQSGDYGRPQLAWMNCLPGYLKGYRFVFTTSPNLPGNELDLEKVCWF